MLTLPAYTLLDVTAVMVGWATVIFLFSKKRPASFRWLGLFLFFFGGLLCQRILSPFYSTDEMTTFAGSPLVLATLLPLLLLAWKERQLPVLSGRRRLVVLGPLLGEVVVGMLLAIALTFAGVVPAWLLPGYVLLSLCINVVLYWKLFRHSQAVLAEYRALQQFSYSLNETLLLRIASGFLLWQLLRTAELGLGEPHLGLLLGGLPSIVALGLVFWLSFYLLRSSLVWRPNYLPEPALADDHPETASALESDAQRALRRIHAHMVEKKPYLRPDLSLQGLAVELELSQRLLSQIINHSSGRNFNRFLNGYRVTEVLEMLSEPANDHLPVTSIGFDAGFNSKATFYAAFKAHTGMSPAEFRNQRKKNILTKKD